jgi:hypothetical protein
MIKTVELNNNVGLHYPLGSRVNGDYLDGLVSDVNNEKAHFFDWRYEVNCFNELVNRSRHILHSKKIDLTNIFNWNCDYNDDLALDLNEDFDTAIMNVLGLKDSISNFFTVITCKGNWYMKIYDDVFCVYSGERTSTELLCLAINLILKLKLKTEKTDGISDSEIDILLAIESLISKKREKLPF